MLAFPTATGDATAGTVSRRIVSCGQAARDIRSIPRDAAPDRGFF